MDTLKLEHRFDPVRNRHYLNNQLFVLHCHHYATLFTQLAIDAHDIVDGTRILKETAEDSFHRFLVSYLKQNGINDPKERMQVGVQLYSAMGLGKMVVTGASESGGDIQMNHAHVDEGWIKKWGQSKTPVNFIGAGCCAALFSAAYGKSLKTYQVKEVQSIVSGAAHSVFKIQR